MYTLVSLFCVIAAVSSTDLQIGTEGGRIIYDSKVNANPAIWKQVQNLTVNATGNEVISRVVVTDLRPNKDGEVNIVEGGEGQKNVTLELKSPTVLRGFEFQVQVYASPDRKGRETVAETPVESAEVTTIVETSIPIANDTVINDDAKPITTDVVNGTAGVPASNVETPVDIEQMKKRDTAPEVTQESKDTEGKEQDTNSEVSYNEGVPKTDQGYDEEDVLSETNDSDSKVEIQDPAVQQQTMKKRDTSDMSQASVHVDEDIPQESEGSDSEEMVEELAIEQMMNKRDTDDMLQKSQVDVSQSQVSVDSDEYTSQDSQESDSEEIAEESAVQQKKKRDTSNMPKDSQESGSEEGQTEDQQRKRAAQEMPQIQISGEMPEIQMPEVQLPEIKMTDVQWPEVLLSEGMPQVQLGVEPEKQPQERAAQETPTTEEIPKENLGDKVPQDNEQLPQDPIAQYVSDQNGSNESPIQAPLVPEAMLEENNSTHFNDSTPIVERSASIYEKETEPTTTEETTTEEPEEYQSHHHHNWHDSHGYY